MKIYHYTTIKTLALILKNKTIRFNRLDGVDDPEEFSYISGNRQTKLFKYIFVSCWTKDREENLPLWKLYNGNKGVRIGMDEDMFGGTMLGKLKCFSLMETNLGGDSIISICNPIKLYDVKYNECVEQNVENLIKEENGLIRIDTGNAGLYKNKKWEFQSESRFKILVLPLPKISSDCEEYADRIQQLFDLVVGMGASLINNEELNLQYVDQPLMLDALNEIEVTMGPMTDEADRFIVESMLRDYPKAKVIDSCFMGKVVK